MWSILWVSRPTKFAGIVSALAEVHCLLVSVSDLPVPHIVVPHQVGAQLQHYGELQVRQTDLLDSRHGQRMEQVVDDKTHLGDKSEETDRVVNQHDGSEGRGGRTLAVWTHREGTANWYYTLRHLSVNIRIVNHNWSRPARWNINQWQNSPLYVEQFWSWRRTVSLFRSP